MKTEEKLLQVILFLTYRSYDDHYFCSGKLAKLVFFADASTVTRHGHTITDLQYFGYRHGPEPIAWGRHLDNAVEEGMIAYAPHSLPGTRGRRRRLYNLKDVEPATVFTPEEQSCLERILRMYGTLPLPALDEISRENVAWQYAAPVEDDGNTPAEELGIKTLKNEDIGKWSRPPTNRELELDITIGG